MFYNNYKAHLIGPVKIIHATVAQFPYYNDKFQSKTSDTANVPLPLLIDVTGISKRARLRVGGLFWRELTQEGILARIGQALGLVIGDVLNAQVFKHFK